MTERFKKAYDSLVRAYFEGTLAKGTCVACGVGNIVADAMGGKITVDTEYEVASCTTDNTFWGTLFATQSGAQVTRKVIDNNVKVTIPSNLIYLVIPEYTATQVELAEYKLKSLTGYSAQEMAVMEWAFETHSKIEWKRYQLHSEQDILQDQFQGLSAMVDVMVELDEVDNADRHLNNKFKEHPKLQLA